MRIVASIFMIIGTIYSLLTTPLFLLWAVPMTVYYMYRTLYKEQNVSVAFKVCTLLFVNMIAGIVMLCDYKRD